MDGADDFLDIDDTEIPGTEAVEDWLRGVKQSDAAQYGSQLDSLVFLENST